VKIKKVIAPCMTRIEIYLTEGTGFLMCDEKRWNEKYNSIVSRFYIPFFWNHKNKFALKLL